MIKFDLYFDDEKNKFVAVNSETGEIRDFEVAKPKTTRKSSKKDENPNPEIILEPNKFVLNNAAVVALCAEADDKIEIKMLHGEPVIGKNNFWGTEGGNRLTKSNTISCRGKANQEIERFGTIFTLEKTDKEGLFKMKGNAPQLPKETEEIANPSDIDDLQELIDEVEIEDNISKFTFNL